MSAIGDIVQIVVPYVGPPGTLINDFGFVCVTSVSDGLNNLANAFNTAMVKNSSGGLLHPVADDYVVSSVVAEDVKPGTAASVEITITPVAGFLAADPLPPQCSAVLSWRTALKGRAYRGRTYLPPSTEDAQSNGNWTSGALTDFNATITHLLEVFGPSGTNGDWRLAVISRVLNGVTRVTPVATQVTSGSVDSRVRTQRRRVLGVGS